MIDTRHAAHRLGGELSGRDQVRCPGPGHGPRDRSLSVLFDPAAPDGFVVHSFAGDDPIECKDHVRDRLNLPAWQAGGRRRARASRARIFNDHVVEAHRNTPHAIRIWQEARDPRHTLVASYLASRKLTLPDDAAEAIRFHSALQFNGASVGGMVALFRDISTNEPCGIHRTFLDANGQKIDRGMLGRAKHAAIKLDADDSVTLGLCIGEGLETCLAGRLAGFRPAWSLGSSGGIKDCPVLPGIEGLTIFGEVGDDGANHRATQKCADRWIAAGREVLLVEPQVGDDLNAVWQEVA
jgi:hypothetical protein